MRGLMAFLTHHADALAYLRQGVFIARVAKRDCRVPNAGRGVGPPHWTANDELVRRIRVFELSYCRRLHCFVGSF